MIRCYPNLANSVQISARLGRRNDGCSGNACSSSTVVCTREQSRLPRTPSRCLIGYVCSQMCANRMRALCSAILPAPPHGHARPASTPAAGSRDAAEPAREALRRVKLRQSSRQGFTTRMSAAAVTVSRRISGVFRVHVGGQSWGNSNEGRSGVGQNGPEVDRGVCPKFHPNLSHRAKTS